MALVLGDVRGATACRGLSVERPLQQVRDHCWCRGPQVASESFLCGSEHLPYPLGSREGLTASAVLQRGGLNFTAVTVTTENNHTIAFLGTSDGQVLKVRPGAGLGLEGPRPAGAVGVRTPAPPHAPSRTCPRARRCT